MTIDKKQAGAELCQAQLSWKLWLKLAVEVVINVGVQLLSGLVVVVVGKIVVE